METVLNVFAMNASYFAAFVQGLGLSASLIIAIGAQNAFVMRQGLRREYALSVATICAFSDAVLIITGAIGLGYLIHNVPLLLPIAKWGGGISLLLYAARSLRNAFRHDALKLASQNSTVANWGKVILTCLAFTWLNPSVYLDTVFLVGSIANTFQGVERWIFVIGAIFASFIWFFGLVYGSFRLAPLFTRPRAWQVFDILISIILILSAISILSR